MANTAQARKRARQNETRRRHNASQRSALRTAIKKATAAAEAGDHAQAVSAYQAAVPVIDRAVTHGLIHRNKAARHKTRINAKVKALAAQPADAASPDEQPSDAQAADAPAVAS